MSAGAAWRWCLAAGLVMLACAWGFARIPGLTACGPTGGLGPVIAFELARSPAETMTIFGTAPCRSMLIPAQRLGLLLDALRFIPAYTAFLCLAARAARRAFAPPVVAALLVAGLLDQIEGGLLFLILRDFPGGEPSYGILFWVVRAKFLLLGLGTLAIAAMLVGWRTMRWFGTILVGLGAVKALEGFFALPDPGMIRGFTLAWAALLGVAAVGAAFPRLLAAPPPAPARPNA